MSLLLVLFRTHCQIAVLLLVVLLKTHCQAAACTNTEPTGELAASSQNSFSGCSTLVSSHEENIPGGSLNEREPSQIHVEELKRCSAELLQQLEKARPCEAASRCTIVLLRYILLKLTSTHGFDAVFVITLLLATAGC